MFGVKSYTEVYADQNLRNINAEVSNDSTRKVHNHFEICSVESRGGSIRDLKEKGQFSEATTVCILRNYLPFC